MRTTEFGFTVKSMLDDSKPEIENLVKNVIGVAKVETSDIDPFYDLSITVEYEGAEDAIRKHKAIARAIQKCGYLTIAAVKTVWTDIYDEEPK